MRKPRILGLLAAFMVGGYAYHLATNVTDGDVAVFHELDADTGGFEANPGDIMAIAPDRPRPQRICLVNVDAPQLHSDDINHVYVNSLGRVLPRYEDAWAMLSGAFTSTPQAATDRVAFSGELRSLITNPQLTSDCECDIASHLLQRERVCTVHGSLVERESGMVRAIQYKNTSNTSAPQVLATCKLDNPESVDVTQAKPCDVRNLPWDAIMRNRLRLIEIESSVKDADSDVMAAR